jgi:hypothetical protein
MPEDTINFVIHPKKVYGTLLWKRRLVVSSLLIGLVAGLLLVYPAPEGGLKASLQALVAEKSAKSLGKKGDWKCRLLFGNFFLASDFKNARKNQGTWSAVFHGLFICLCTV